jgi:phenylacetate-CoA ligase
MDLANEVIEENIKGIDIRQIFSAGEWLDETIVRKATQAFSANIFNMYGAIELGRIANECREHRGLHVASEYVVVEATRNGEALETGEEGEITVTNLDNYAMPFIRYNLQDIGLLKGDDCPCGSCLPMMKLRGGRAKDRFKLPNGRMVSALVLREKLIHIDGIRQFQIVQEEIDRYVVKLVKGRGYREDIGNQIRSTLKPILGDAGIDITIVPYIPKSRTGKTRQFISSLSTPANGY